MPQSEELLIEAGRGSYHAQRAFDLNQFVRQTNGWLQFEDDCLERIQNPPLSALFTIGLVFRRLNVPQADKEKVRRCLSQGRTPLCMNVTHFLQTLSLQRSRKAQCLMDEKWHTSGYVPVDRVPVCINAAWNLDSCVLSLSEPEVWTQDEPRLWVACFS